MADFYTLLGIDRSADSAQLRAAYKKLALQYHPDRNPGNPEAEEMFKAINEAYHILSDPLKKSRYDSRFTSNPHYANKTEDLWREFQQQQYRRWRASQQPNRYRFDKEYFRIQGLAFLTFLIISGFCFGLIHTVYFFHELEQEKIDKQNRILVMNVNSLFSSGKIEEAFVMITDLRDNNPMEYRFYVTHDSLLSEIRNKAEQEFKLNNYSESLHFLEILKRQETPQRLETLRKLAVCEYKTGDFRKALQTLKQIYSLQPWNLEILYQIGLISLENEKDHEQALYYFTLGKKIFKENLTRIYGAAFEVVMMPEDVPDVYFEIFEARARTNLALEDYSEAEKDCNWAIFLRPKNADPYVYRVIAKVNQQKNWSICVDVAMAKKLGAEEADKLQRKYCR
ncbi:MAG: DnaJ domain-containing protein [Cyclobacteriaceae bacterium]|nr:DnaJ domain-containing protein [Cyclobacteriaceae bacterium]